MVAVLVLVLVWVWVWVLVSVSVWVLVWVLVLVRKGKGMKTHLSRLLLISALGLVLAIMFASAAQSIERGIASRYCDAVTSTGKMDCNALTVAHKTLPFGTRVLVFNRWNKRWVIAMVNDRGPCTSEFCNTKMPARVRKRILDMSPATAAAIGSKGLTLVVVIPLSTTGREF